MPWANCWAVGPENHVCNNKIETGTVNWIANNKRGHPEPTQRKKGRASKFDARPCSFSSTHSIHTVSLMVGTEQTTGSGTMDPLQLAG